jgi:hypothetical protein
MIRLFKKNFNLKRERLKKLDDIKRNIRDAILVNKKFQLIYKYMKHANMN